ncbi:3-oxoacyl-ACP reductase FabG [Opitutus sp. ER46]|uniref:SDR family NAD(P)-dependent oxidoreductase n=1 Tax=Opitutus sp. ER46 TaxID=2161864 RepID=UPI000D30C1F4|nr:3-oxoacyl-ACP reductase FabG [Opitutus sp. ER46]PTX91382.1 short-chain dehydrogenase [Opitutus sp. ER46]
MTSPQPLPLFGQTALVTGAARGIGAAIARALAGAGADVVVNDLAASPEAEATCAAIRATGRRALFIACDVGDEPGVQRMFAAAAAEFGRLDILVNNAGIVRHEDIFATTLESWNAVLRTHLTGTFLCSREAMRIMREQRSGRIIQISSVVAHQGALYGFVHYATAKSGMLGFTRTLARTGAPFGITVNAIAPGIVDSEMLRQTHSAKTREGFTQSVPLGVSPADDIGAAAVYLASPAAARISGTVIDVNGGMYFR